MYWNGHMGGVWWQVLAGLGFVLFWAAVITVIILLARYLRANPRPGGPGWGGPPQQAGWVPPPPTVPPGQHAPQPGVRAEDVLAERFARGEIDEAEYRARLDVLRQQRGGAQGPVQ